MSELGHSKSRKGFWIGDWQDYNDALEDQPGDCVKTGERLKVGWPDGRLLREISVLFAPQCSSEVLYPDCTFESPGVLLKTHWHPGPTP